MPCAVVTGSTKGLGFGLAAALRARGFDVVISGRSPDAVDAAVTKLRARAGDGRVLGFPTDVSDAAQVQALWDRTSSELGRIDLWINNAGLAKTTRDIMDLPATDVRQMVTTNMLGTIFGSQVAVRGMTQQSGGKLFNILGGGSDGRIRPRMGVYGATKRGLKMFTDALVKETRGGPVLIGEVRPGILVTDGMIREAEEMDSGELAKYVRTMDVLADRVDDVAPWLVDRILASDKHGAAIAWLTTGKIARRFATSRWAGRDAFSAAVGTAASG